jgi:hypothetical protein
MSERYHRFLSQPNGHGLKHGASMEPDNSSLSALKRTPKVDQKNPSTLGDVGWTPTWVWLKLIDPQTLTIE